MSLPAILRGAAGLAAMLLLASCADAPLSKTYVCRSLSPGQYCVQSGDTLSRIAQRFHTDVASLKAWNRLRDDMIHPGQALTVAQAGKPAASAPGGFSLQYPLKGTTIIAYGENRNKGIDIAAPRGTLVHAAADGTVIYSGSSVPGYGKLLLIRHNDSVITAYANNDSLLVPDKAQVKAGQIVASVGDSNRSDGRTALHFEVRVNGKHVNPALYLR